MNRRPQHLSVIAAVARNGAIGRDNALLWHIREDLQFFKRTTLGCPVVMGRKTYESIGRPLPGRRNVVITRNPTWRADSVEVAASLNAALDLLHDAPKVFVIGGAEIYAHALPVADELILTEIDQDYDGDCFFPDWDRSAFQAVSREPQLSAEGLAYSWVEYRRRQVPA